MTRRLALTFVILVSLGSTACFDNATLQRLSDTRLSVDILREITTGELSHVGAVSAHLGQSLIAALSGMLCIYLWYRVHSGEPWVGLAKEMFIGIGVSMVLVATWNQPVGVPQLIYDTTQSLADAFTPAGARALSGVFAKQMTAVSQAGNWLKVLGDLVETGSLSEAVRRQAEAWLAVARLPQTLLFMSLAAGCAAMVRVFMYATFTFLVALHWVTMPLFAPMLVLPQTRRVFYGWLQSYLSVCLWPVIWAIYDIIMFVLPWSNLTGFDVLRDGLDWTAFQAGYVVLAILNLAFVAAYLSVPIVASKIVSGSIRAATA